MNADQDGDGKISKEEAPERMRERFDRMDADGDGDGQVDEAELKRAMARFMRERGRGSSGARRPPERPERSERQKPRPEERQRQAAEIDV